MGINKKPKIVVISGAESTGKSILTKQLAHFYQSPSFAEFSREYIEKTGRSYTYDDVVSIALMQNAQMNKSFTINAKYVFFDTWLIITMIWFDVVFGKIPQWIPETIRNTPVDLFLLCDTDLPWIPDPVRENGGEMREMLQIRYIELINRFGFSYNLVSGHSEERLKNAVEFINAI
jgi:nicotinamide riboside kinase